MVAADGSVADQSLMTTVAAQVARTASVNDGQATGLFDGRHLTYMYARHQTTALGSAATLTSC